MGKAATKKQEKTEGTVVQMPVSTEQVLEIVKQLSEQQQRDIFVWLTEKLEEKRHYPNEVREEGFTVSLPMDEDGVVKTVVVKDGEELSEILKKHKPKYSMDELAGSVFGDLSEEEFQQLVEDMEAND